MVKRNGVCVVYEAWRSRGVLGDWLVQVTSGSVCGGG